MAGQYQPISSETMNDFLTGLGFTKVPIIGVKEIVYERKYGFRTYMRVYSSVVGSSTRASGKDAIKCVAICKVPGKADCIIAHTTRINRTGAPLDVLFRLEGRINDLQILAPQPVMDSRGMPMTLRKNRKQGTYFWGQPDWNLIPKNQRETRPHYP